MLKLDMKYYISSMIEDFFPYVIRSIKTSPWTEKLFKVNTESKRVDEKDK